MINELIKTFFENCGNIFAIVSAISTLLVFCYKVYYQYSFKKYYGINNEYSELPKTVFIKKVFKIIFTSLLILIYYFIREYMWRVSYNAYQLFISYTFIEYFFISIHVYIITINFAKYDFKILDSFNLLLVLTFIYSLLISYYYYVEEFKYLEHVSLIIFFVSCLSNLYLNFSKIKRYDVFKYKNAKYAIISFNKSNIIAIKMKSHNKVTHLCYGKVLIINPNPIEIEKVSYNYRVKCIKE